MTQNTRMTKIAAATLALSLALTSPAAAEQEQGFNLMEEGARLLFRGLMQEMEPALNDLDALSDELEPALRGFAENMGPALGELLGKVDDFSKYHGPEILPNGDIIMRRKQSAAPSLPEGEIDL
jgi:hypothetical protein